MFEQNDSGLWELHGIDVDGDGLPDIFALDTDGDGNADALLVADGDTDGEFAGPPSDFAEGAEHTYGIDSDGDSVIDTWITETDLDGDGSVDTVRYAMDTDGDNLPDVFGEAIAVDADHDGEYDSILFGEADAGAPIFEAQATFSAPDADPFIETVQMAQSGMPPDAIAMYNASRLETFNPANQNPGAIVGDPASAMKHWHPQETDSSCAVASQEFVLDQLTGHDFSEADLRGTAEDYGWYADDAGTLFYNIGNLLTEHGLSVTRDYGNSLGDIEHCLSEGGGAVVAVDVYELYGVNIPGEGANHAIQVIGIDNSDPASPMVIVNDPAIENGGGLMIPAGDFAEAWEDAGNLLVEAYANEGERGATWNEG